MGLTPGPDLHTWYPFKSTLIHLRCCAWDRKSLELSRFTICIIQNHVPMNTSRSRLPSLVNECVSTLYTLSEAYTRNLQVTPTSLMQGTFQYETSSIAHTLEPQ